MPLLLAAYVLATGTQARADLYAASATTHEILRYRLDDLTNPQVFLTADDGLFHPLGMAFAPDGDLFVHNAYPTPRVLRYSAQGDYKGVFTDQMGNSTFMAFGPDGNLYVGDQQNDRVSKYDGATGALLQSAYMTIPTDMVFLPNGDLLVADFFSGAVIRLAAGSMDDLGVFASVGFNQNAFGMALGPDQNLYVSSYLANEVKRFDGATGQFIDNFIAGAGLDRPWDIEFGAEGDLYVADEGTRAIWRFDGTTGAHVQTLPNATFLGLGTPLLLATNAVPEPAPPVLATIAWTLAIHWRRRGLSAIAVR